MKYKKHFVTGALAISLLVSGSNILAATPQDLGIKNSQEIYHKTSNIQKKIARTSTVGTILSINKTGFTVNVKNIKTKITSSVDAKTDIETKYTKNGASTSNSSLSVGQKVIINGYFDKTTNIISAKTVKIVTR